MINCNCPKIDAGHYDTDQSTGLETPEAYRALMTLAPYKRTGEPEDIAQAVFDAADHVTGVSRATDHPLRNRDREESPPAVDKEGHSGGAQRRPALGSLLIHALSWRRISWINVLVGLLGAAMGRLVLPRMRAYAGDRQFDWGGASA